jgi:hypothetical protein
MHGMDIKPYVIDLLTVPVVATISDALVCEAGDYFMWKMIGEEIYMSCCFSRVRPAVKLQLSKSLCYVNLWAAPPLSILQPS